MTDNTRHCARQGCTRRVPQHSHRDTCSSNCAVLRRVSAENQRIVGVIGECLAADQLRAAEQDMIAAYDSIIQIRKNLRLQANASGITDAAWAATIRNGVRRDPTCTADH